MEYYFNNLSPVDFQRLINGILIKRFGEGVRLTPLRGADGGSDAETAPGNPFFEYQSQSSKELGSESSTPGRYLFQVKHHRTIDLRLSDARSQVISDFGRELKKNVLPRIGDEQVNYFFLITNVPASKDSILAVDQKRRELLKDHRNLHADVWWQERVVALLDHYPSLWNSFPSLFAGGKPPFFADLIDKPKTGLSRAIRMALAAQYKRDSVVKFKQIELEKTLTKLFVDLDLDFRYLEREEWQPLLSEWSHTKARSQDGDDDIHPDRRELRLRWARANYLRRRSRTMSALGVLLSEGTSATRKIILEGGPGQGKSTITQMMAQIYRNGILGETDLNPDDRWVPPEKKRLPMRMELRQFAEWLVQHDAGSVEEFLGTVFQKDAGGSVVSVEDIHNMAENSPVFLIFDGLDEVGSDELRDVVVSKIAECVERFESSLHSDLRVVVTTRPPAIAGRREQLGSFRRFPIAPLEQETIESYLERWVSVQVHDDEERDGVRSSFKRRQNETHVKALVKNPMQLSVLLHFIRLKGEAFPDRRAELYRDYFRIVIDRDVEKSPELRQKREIIEALHQLLGYKIHVLTEAEQADGTLTRNQLLEIVQQWMKSQGSNPKTANDIFRLGEERLGLIVALRGEGEEARYGYEIQPIREYFAAAYMNEQIQGNAHEVFQSLVYRQYWKEVALFLAGLRRPNEKADLITRAKEVDQNPVSGWRQDGRAIVLQLLQEGVFSQPRHVFSEAMDFLIDVLDTTIVRVPNEPKEMLDTLPGLIKQGDVERHTQRILAILENHTIKSDPTSLHRCYRILSRLLSPTRMRALLMTYEGTQGDLFARLRILWPSLWGIDMAGEATALSFWQPLPGAAAARSLWNAALVSDTATGLTPPQRLHSRLFERYSLGSDSIFDRLNPGGFTIMRPRSNWAIWRLISLQQSLFSQNIGIELEKRSKNAIARVPDVDFGGLDRVTTELVSALIVRLTELLRSLNEDKDYVERALHEYVSTIITFLDRGGLVGLIACRTGFYLMDVFRYGADQGPTTLSDAFDNLENQELFVRKLLAFMGITASSKEDPFRKFYEKIHRERATITHIKVDNRGTFIAISDLLADYICYGTKLPFPWLERIPVQAAFLRSLVDKCQSCLPNLLSFLSEHQFERTPNPRPLLVQSIQRILKIARTTSDAKVLEGCVVALASSKFLNLAAVKTTLKLIQATAGKEEIAQAFFSLRRTEPKEISVLIDVAKRVIKDAPEYPLAACISAANYLTEHLPFNHSPLLSIESELGLQIQTRLAVE